MPKSHPPYPAEYRRRIIELVRAGRSVNELAREFEPWPMPFVTGSSKPVSMKACAERWLNYG